MAIYLKCLSHKRLGGKSSVEGLHNVVRTYTRMIFDPLLDFLLLQCGMA